MVNLGSARQRKGSGFLWVIHRGNMIRKYMREPNGRGGLSTVCTYDEPTRLGLNVLSPMIRTFSSSWYQEGTFLMGNFCPAFRQKRWGWRAVSQLLTAQKNQYANATYFWVPCFDPLYFQINNMSIIIIYTYISCLNI